MVKSIFTIEDIQSEQKTNSFVVNNVNDNNFYELFAEFLRTTFCVKLDDVTMLEVIQPSVLKLCLNRLEPETAINVSSWENELSGAMEGIFGGDSIIGLMTEETHKELINHLKYISTTPHYKIHFWVVKDADDLTFAHRDTFDANDSVLPDIIDQVLRTGNGVMILQNSHITTIHVDSKRFKQR